jgi:hypothetical protein
MGESRVEAIVAQAYRELDVLYGVVGSRRVEQPVKKRGRPTLVELSGGDREVQCGYAGCMERVRAADKFCKLHTYEALRRDAKRRRAELDRVIESGRVIDLRGFSGQGIINKVLEVTGELIPVCRKSKINVIRHAQMIADRLGMRLVI